MIDFLKKLIFHQGTNAYTLNGDTTPTAPGTGPVRWSVSVDQGRALMNLTRDKRVLEIGTGTGYSTLMMASHAKEVHTFDMDDTVIAWVHRCFEKNVFGYDRRLQPLAAAGTDFDVIFVDGGHRREDVIKDIHEATPLMKPDALWIFHDTHMQSVMRGIEASGTWEQVGPEYRDYGPTRMKAYRKLA